MKSDFSEVWVFYKLIHLISIFSYFPLYLHRIHQNRILNEKKTKRRERERAKRTELGKDLNQNINLLLKNDLEKIL